MLPGCSSPGSSAAARCWPPSSSNPLHGELLEEPLEVARDGTIAPPSGPGLEIRLRPDVVERYLVTK